MVWPAKEYAEAVLSTEDIAKLRPAEIHNFLDAYIDDFIAANVFLFVFPNKELNGAIMSAESFRNMMQEELDRME